MNPAATVPAVALPDGTTLVTRATAALIQANVLTDMVLELRDAVQRGWYVYGYAPAPEPAAEAIDAFSVGVAHLDTLKHAAIRESISDGPSGVLFSAFVTSATIHAAQQMIDMTNDGKVITFGPKQ